MRKPWTTWHRPRLRWGLRGQAVAVLALACAFGAAVHLARRARDQRELVAAISTKGVVLYDWQWRDGRYVQGPPPWPSWLVRAVGIDALSSPVSVDLSVPRLKVFAGRTGPSSGDDALMALIGRLDRLEFLDLTNNPRITDAGLVHLRRLTRLRRLRIGFLCGVRGPGLVHLRGLNRLESLSLGPGLYTDADLAPLADLTSLRELSVRSTRLTDAGLAHLKGLVNLKRPVSLRGSNARNSE